MTDSVMEFREGRLVSLALKSSHHKRGRGESREERGEGVEFNWYSVGLFYGRHHYWGDKEDKEDEFVRNELV